MCPQWSLTVVDTVKCRQNLFSKGLLPQVPEVLSAGTVGPSDDCLSCRDLPPQGHTPSPEHPKGWPRLSWSVLEFSFSLCPTCFSILLCTAVDLKGIP